MKLDTKNINKLIEMAKEQDIILEEAQLIQWILIWQKIVTVINSSGKECELKLGDHKLTAKHKNYNSEKLTINVKRNRN